MSRSKQTSKGRGRSRVVTALGIAGALSLTGGASASNSATQNTAPVILAEEEISDISLATFYVFDKENAGAHRWGHGLLHNRGAANREAANRQAANKEAANREAVEAVEARAVEVTEAVEVAAVAAQVSEAVEVAAAAAEAAV